MTHTTRYIHALVRTDNVEDAVSDSVSYKICTHDVWEGLVRSKVTLCTCAVESASRARAATLVKIILQHDCTLVQPYSNSSCIVAEMGWV